MHIPSLVPAHTRRGETLIELLVALVILEIAGAMALGTALTVERLGQRAERGAAVDAGRWVDDRIRAADSACVAAIAPDTATMIYPATPERPALDVVWRCGP